MKKEIKEKIIEILKTRLPEFTEICYLKASDQILELFEEILPKDKNDTWHHCLQEINQRIKKVGDNKE